MQSSAVSKVMTDIPEKDIVSRVRSKAMEKYRKEQEEKKK